MHPESKIRLARHNLAVLPKDINGEVDGASYCPFLEIQDMRAVASVRHGKNGVWSGRLHHLASGAEEQWFVVNEGKFEIISIREGYWMAKKDAAERVMIGEKPPRRDFFTFDFVLTLASRNFMGPLRYHAVSVKPDTVQLSEMVKRRSSREQGACAAIGWTWSYAKKPTATEFANHLMLREWAKAYAIDDAREEAAQLATLYYSTTSQKSLRACLRAFSRRLGFTEADAFFVLAAAYYLGCIAIDHSAPLDEDSPLRLLPIESRGAVWSYGK